MKQKNKPGIRDSGSIREVPKPKTLDPVTAVTSSQVPVGTRDPKLETLDTRPKTPEPLTSTTTALTKAELAVAIHTQESAWILMKLWENPQNLKNLVELLKDPEHAFKAALLFFHACGMGTDVQPVATDLWRMVMADELYADQETKIKLLGIACRARIDDEIIGPIKELLWKKRTKGMLEELSNALDAARNETAAKPIIEMLAGTAVDGTTRSVRSNARYALLMLVRKGIDISPAFAILKNTLTDTRLPTGEDKKPEILLAAYDAAKEEKLGTIKLAFEAAKNGSDPSDILSTVIEFLATSVDLIPKTTIPGDPPSTRELVAIDFLLFLCTDDRYRETFRDRIIIEMAGKITVEYTVDAWMEPPLEFSCMASVFLKIANERYIDVSAAVPKLFELLLSDDKGIRMTGEQWRPCIREACRVLKNAAENGNGKVLTAITVAAQQILSSEEFRAYAQGNNPGYQEAMEGVGEIMKIVRERECWIEHEQNKGKTDETKE